MILVLGLRTRGLPSTQQAHQFRCIQSRSQNGVCHLTKLRSSLLRISGKGLGLSLNYMPMLILCIKRRFKNDPLKCRWISKISESSIKKIEILKSRVRRGLGRRDWKEIIFATLKGKSDGHNHEAPRNVLGEDIAPSS
jgi:hypothetical protein